MLLDPVTEVLVVVEAVGHAVEAVGHIVTEPDPLTELDPLFVIGAVG